MPEGPLEKSVLRIVEDVEFSYKGDNNYIYRLPAGFELSIGDRVCIWGPNGAGKSTLLTMLAGLRRFETGRIDYCLGDTLTTLTAENWGSVSGPDLWGRVGFAFQRPELINSLRAVDNLGIVMGNNAYDTGGALWGIDEPPTPKLRNARGEWNEVSDKLPTRLSGGQRQRIGIARAFGQGQSLVIVDEPTNNLDIDNRERAAGFLVERSAEVALVVVSHEIEFLRQLNLTALYRVIADPPQDLDGRTVRRLERLEREEIESFFTAYALEEDGELVDAAPGFHARSDGSAPNDPSTDGKV